MNDPLPKPDSKDNAHLTTRALLGAIPFAGAGAVELFNRLITPPIQRRRDAWLNRLAERVSTLEQERKINIKELTDDEEFVSTIMQASQIAIRNHQQEKLDALQNAVLNTAIKQAPEDSIREMFLSLIDRFSFWHLRILDFLAAPYEWLNRNSLEPPAYHRTSSQYQLLQIAFPELVENKDFFEAVINDLDSYKLIRNGGLLTLSKPTHYGENGITELGNDFLKFITAPDIQ